MDAGELEPRLQLVLVQPSEHGSSLGGLAPPLAPGLVILDASTYPDYDDVTTQDRRDIMTDTQPTDARMPALYIGHGAPPLLDDALWSSQLAAWATRPAASEGDLTSRALGVGAGDAVRERSARGWSYDFGGFPQRSATRYLRDPGRDGARRTIAAMMPDTEPVHQHSSRGLDHGAWVPLKIMCTRPGDIPVCRCPSPTDDPYRLLELGRRLRPLRDEGVLIIGSGFLTMGPAVPARVPHRRGGGGRGKDFDGWAAEGWPAVTSTSWRRTAPRRRACPTRPHGRALHPAVHHPRRGLRPRDAGRPGRRRLLDGALQALAAGRLRLSRPDATPPT